LDRTQIEAIEVLKGPSAIKDYGGDAKNGVIVVKTKRWARSYRTPSWRKRARSMMRPRWITSRILLVLRMSSSVFAGAMRAMS